MKIDNFEIGKEETFIVGELSGNHNHSIEIAKKTIKAMKDSGVNAVKTQTYTPDTITIDCDNEYFKLNQGTIWDGQPFYDLYKKAYTPFEWQEELMKYANSIDLIFFSTPFDKTAVDLLEKINVPAYKIASFEIMDIPLIEYVASTGKPIIMSTGIASLSDIEYALNTCYKVGNRQIILLKCTSSYPAKPEDANLLTIPNMKKTFNVEVGLSDHTLGFTVPIAAVTLGAKVVEKHFILDRNMGGPDASFSMNPIEFKIMIDSIRDTEKALGKIDYTLDENKINNRTLGKSLFIVKDIKKDEKFTSENLKSIRPGFGLHPKFYKDILGKKSNIDLKKGMPMQFKYINEME